MFIMSLNLIPKQEGGGNVNQNQIDQLRMQIQSNYEARIDQLRKDMATDLDALARLEPTLRNLIDKSEDKRLTKLVVPLTGQARFHKRDGKLSVKKLFKISLDKMNEPFGREALYQKVNEEAGEEIKKGSFGPVFAEFVKKGKIVEVEKPSGSKAGLYRRKPEFTRVQLEN